MLGTESRTIVQALIMSDWNDWVVIMSKVKENKMEYLMQIAEERYRKQGKELSDSEKDSIYYSILGVYRNKNYGAAHSYVLSAELSL